MFYKITYLLRVTDITYRSGVVDLKMKISANRSVCDIELNKTND